jgi:hypothetical protein
VPEVQVKTVVHIESRDGVKGGAGYWYLDLECGHHAVRAKRPFRPWNIFDPLSKFLAPKRVNCPVCDGRTT